MTHAPHPREILLGAQAGVQALRNAETLLAGECPEQADGGAGLVSALNGSGLDEVALRLRSWTQPSVGLQTTT